MRNVQLLTKCHEHLEFARPVLKLPFRRPNIAHPILTIVEDLSRVMNRLKALYRSWAIPCAGRDVYYGRHRAEWLAKIREAGVRRRAERLYEQLDMLTLASPAYLPLAD